LQSRCSEYRFPHLVPSKKAPDSHVPLWPRQPDQSAVCSRLCALICFRPDLFCRLRRDRLTVHADPSSSPPAGQRQAQPAFRIQDQADALGQENLSYNNAPQASLDKETPPSGPIQTPVLRSQPIVIPSTPAHRRDPDRIPTPLSGRGDRKGHCFPFSRTPSPNDGQVPDDILEDITNSPQRPRRSSSSSSRLRRSQFFSGMHADQMAARYTPTSPLSPRLPATSRPLSPQPPRRRAHHSRNESRGLNVSLPRYHPANFPQGDGPTSTAQFQGPSIVLNRAPNPTVVETPRIMRERQRELIDRAKLSSKIAASAMGVKPDAPRLDPLGSPKGPMTPLALEDGAGDYFAAPKKLGSSPAVSPGSRSDSSLEAGEEDNGGKRGAKGKTSSPR
jgi:hypothetical protein